MSKAKEDLYWAVLRSEMKAFAKHAFDYLYPGTQFLDNWHIDVIVHALDQARAGKCSRLIVNLPPRHLKSFLVSVVYPAFVLGHDPAARIIGVSYADELTQQISRDFRRLVESVWYQKLFPQMRITKSTENEIVTDQGGSRYGTSVGGSLTGRGADIMIIDDPIKPSDALSDKLRQKNNEWFRTTALSRLNDKKLSVMILVMQRLHVNDLTGFLENSGFTKIAIPAIARKPATYCVGEGDYVDRPEGDVLQPEREDTDTLNALRDQMGPQNFAAQYQQDPMQPEGAMLKRAWFRIVEGTLNKKADGRWWIAIDAAASTAETADYTSIIVGFSSNVDGCHYVLHAERGRWDFEELLALCLHYNKMFLSVTFVVEATSNGLPLVAALKKRNIMHRHHFPLTDKVHRAALMVPVFAEKRVVLLRNSNQDSSWIDLLMNEVVSFPYGRFDDQVDSLVMGVTYGEHHSAAHAAWRAKHPDGFSQKVEAQDEAFEFASF